MTERNGTAFFRMYSYGLHFCVWKKGHELPFQRYGISQRISAYRYVRVLESLGFQAVKNHKYREREREREREDLLRMGGCDHTRSKDNPHTASVSGIQCCLHCLYAISPGAVQPRRQPFASTSSSSYHQRFVSFAWDCYFYLVPCLQIPQTQHSPP
jgi:hypothetical protein